MRIEHKSWSEMLLKGPYRIRYLLEGRTGRGGEGVTAHGHRNFVFPNQESKEVRYSF